MPSLGLVVGGPTRFNIEPMRRAVLSLSLLAACGGADDAALDGGPTDARPATLDASLPDASLVDASFAPMTLAETGLYSDPVNETLAPGVVEYTVNYPLWADGAEKRRFVYLPYVMIDTSDMDFWHLPPGTKLWKEFTRDGVRVETRLLWKQGLTDDDWFAMSFAWNADGTEAIAAPNGVEDARGTPHDIPRATDCKTCHERSPGFALGFAALQLDHAEGEINLASLAATGRLSNPPAGREAPLLPLPGDPTAQAALGYLHGNCGPCHNESSDVQQKTPLIWRLDVDSLATVEDTAAFRTAVGVAPQIQIPGYPSVIEPGDRSASAAYFRMGQRDPTNDSNVPMPPLSTEEPDGNGMAAVGEWIDSLAP